MVQWALADQAVDQPESPQQCRLAEEAADKPVPIASFALDPDVLRRSVRKVKSDLRVGAGHGVVAVRTKIKDVDHVETVCSGIDDGDRLSAVVAAARVVDVQEGPVGQASPVTVIDVANQYLATLVVLSQVDVQVLWLLCPTQNDPAQPVSLREIGFIFYLH